MGTNMSPVIMAGLLITAMASSMVPGAQAVVPIHESPGETRIPELQEIGHIDGDAIQVSAGGYHTCALLTNGNVHCWGDNNKGQSRGYSGGDAVEVAAGGDHTCARLDNGNVNCWGWNEYGQANDYTGGNAVQVAAGWYHTCALLSNGNVHCWGAGESEPPFGVGLVLNADDEPHWGQSAEYMGGNAVQVAVGSSFSCALLDDGSKSCWGQGEAVASISPAHNLHPNPLHPKQISAGYGNVCELHKSGNVACWAVDSRGSGLQGVFLMEAAIFGVGETTFYPLGDAVQVSTGLTAHSCVLKEDGNVACWGSGLTFTTPMYVGGDAIQVSAGGFHACVLRTSGSVDCFFMYGEEDPLISHWERGQSQDYPWS